MSKLTDQIKAILQVAETLAAGVATVIGSYVDRTGWRWATFVLGVGATDATVDMKIQESDDASTWTDITDAHITQITATGDNREVVIEVDLGASTARKRYLKPVVTVGAGTGAALACFALLSNYSQSVADVAPADLKEVVEV